MADEIREARRRRILENSEKRLQRILGLSEKDGGSKPVLTEEENITNLIPSHEQPIRTSFVPPNNINSNELPKVDKIHSTSSNKVFSATEINKLPTNFGEAFNLNGNIEEGQKNWAWTLVLLAITSITILYTNYGLLIGHNILIPFLVFELYVYFTARNILPSQLNSVVKMVLLMSGLQPQTLQKFARIFEIFQTLIQDLCVYLFACLMCYQVYIGIV